MVPEVVVVRRRYNSLMCADPVGGREAVFAALDVLQAHAEALTGLAFDAVSELDCVAAAERLNRIARMAPAAQYELINSLVERAVPSDIGGPLARVLADRLTIRPSAARRLIKDAAQVGHIGGRCRGSASNRCGPPPPPKCGPQRSGPSTWR
jgi:hypothetical protein